MDFSSAKKIIHDCVIVKKKKKKIKQMKNISFCTCFLPPLPLYT